MRILPNTTLNVVLPSTNVLNDRMRKAKTFWHIYLAKALHRTPVDLDRLSIKHRADLTTKSSSFRRLLRRQCDYLNEDEFDEEAFCDVIGSDSPARSHVTVRSTW